MLRAVLTDLEGTTTSLSFVKNTLFPYARAQLPAFVQAHPDEPVVQAALAAAQSEQADRPPVETLLAWIDQDRKIGPLKALQGRIWRSAYEAGAVQGHLWPDAVSGLQRFAALGLQLSVFSSGSVEAQQLLFRHSVAGDLSPLIAAWFDTSVGAKQSSDAYGTISARLGLPAVEILFLSDVPAELDAARAAGMQTCCLERGEAGLPPPHAHRRVASFDALP